MAYMCNLPRDGQSRTEDQIECAVEREFDRLDAYFMHDGSPMTQAEYEAGSVAISAWAAIEYRFAAKMV